MLCFRHTRGLLICIAAGLLCAQTDTPKNPPRQPGARKSGPMAQKPAAPRKGILDRPQRDAKAQPKMSLLLRSAPTPITALDRWNRMSPEQRHRALAKLPPERQQQIQRRLQEFNALPRDEQDRLRRRYERFSHLPEEKQQLVRRQIQAFSRLPEDRRPDISREFEELRRLPREERLARINSEEFRSRYNPREQQLLTDLSENLAIPQPR